MDIPSTKRKLIRLALQQRVLPDYRTGFVDGLARSCGGGLSVFAGLPVEKESIKTMAPILVDADWTPSYNRHFLDPSSPFYLCWQPGILEWLESWRPEVLIVEANPRYLSTPSAIRWMHARRRPVLGWGLGAPPLSGPLAGWRAWERKRFLGSLDGVIAYSQRGAHEYAAMGMPADRVFWAPNAVALPPAEPPPDRPASFASKPVVLFVGRLQARKRIDLLLQACAGLPAELQPRLVIVGDGPDRAEMEAQAKQAYPSAEFPGAKYGAELAAYFKQADLFVLPGTGGLAVQQALGYGLPAIVAQGDGTQEDLVRPGNGWLVPPGDLQALSQALRKALSNAPRLRQMGARGYRIVSGEVNLATMVGGFLFAAERVLALGLRQDR